MAPKRQISIETTGGAQVHGAQAVLDIEETSVEHNGKAGVLAFAAGEARLLAGTRVHHNGGKGADGQVLAGAEALRTAGGRIRMHKRVQLPSKALVEGGGRVVSM